MSTAPGLIVAHVGDEAEVEVADRVTLDKVALLGGSVELAD